jgi:hypothetical protein
MKKLTLIFFIVSWLINNNCNAQYFYHHEDFLNDSAFILKHNIKVATIRIPTLMNDTTTEAVPFQKLCYNPYGKLAWYEYDTIAHSITRKYYTWHFYDDYARRFKSRVFQRCNDIDSLREEIRYEYSAKGDLLQEYHYQIYILAYREWSFSYDWQDSIKVRIDDLDIADTARLDAHKREVDFVRDSVRYFVKYNNKGKREKVEYFKITSKDELVKLDELNFFYNDADQLVRVLSLTSEVIFRYNGKLPGSSITKDRFTGQQIGHEITYEFEFRDPFFSTN